MQKIKFEYEEKHHILEVDGVEYEIPQRTTKIEAKIREHDEKLSGMSEYEANMSVLEILFGKANAKKMFPDKEKTNLDKLAKCTKFAIALYMAEYNALRDEDIKAKMDAIGPMLDSLKDTGELLKQTQSQGKVQKGISRRK